MPHFKVFKETAKETKITDSHSRVFGPFWANKGVSFSKNTRKDFKTNLVIVNVFTSH